MFYYARSCGVLQKTHDLKIITLLVIFISIYMNWFTGSESSCCHGYLTLAISGLRLSYFLKLEWSYDDDIYIIIQFSQISPNLIGVFYWFCLKAT